MQAKNCLWDIGQKLIDKYTGAMNVCKGNPKKAMSKLLKLIRV